MSTLKTIHAQTRMAGPGRKDNGGTDVIERPPVVERSTKPKNKTERPKMYNVLVHNDDTTFPPFVSEMICKYFNRSAADSQRIMMTAHRTGIALVNTYTKEVAEEKVNQANTESRASDQHIGPVCELTFSAEPSPGM